MRTPSIDALAREGVRFENAFVSGPVCSASRSAVITGMYQTSIGAHNHRSNRQGKLPQGVLPVTSYLREAGYFTCNGQFDSGEQGKMDYNFAMSFDQVFDGTDWGDRRPGQPFFAEVHFIEAHRAFKADPEHPIDPDDVELPPYYPEHPITRMDWALYLETVQRLDTKVGRVLQRLREEDLEENTAVFFWGDHGRAMVRGKQFLYDEGIRIPLIVRWPGRLEPNTVRRDLVSTIDLAPTWLEMSGWDAPRRMQGRSLFDRTQPRQCVYAARDRCDETVDMIRCVRTEQYKYIRNFHPERPYTQFNAYKKLQYPVLTLMEVLESRGELSAEQSRFMASARPVEELYDLHEDPFELQNLAGDPGHGRVLNHLRERLGAWASGTKDRGRAPESRVVVQRWRGEARTRFAETMKKRGLRPDVSNEDYLSWWEGKLREIRRVG